jgi:large subunit ribosomal protein L25
MRKDITVAAESRDSRGKNEARRLRVKGVVPAVLYGGEAGPLPVSVNPKELTRILNSKTGHNTIFNLNVTDKENTPVMIVDWQHDPIKESLLHVDLKRIDLSHRIDVKVPVITQGDPKGVNVTELLIGQSIRAADIPLTGSMKLLSPGDAVISHVVSLRAEAEPVAEGAATGVPEPEVAAKKGKKEEEAAAAPAKAAAPAAKKK